MAIFAKAGPSFKPAPAGAHAAVCCDVIDLGEMKVVYAGKEKKQHKIRIVWQIPELRDDGNQFTVSKRYTLSLHEKSTLRKDLESWRGRSFTESELEQFDVEVLLSAPAMINVNHTSKQGTTYADVTSIMRLPKGMEAPKVVGYIRVCDRKPEDGHSAPDVDFGGIDDSDVPF